MKLPSWVILTLSTLALVATIAGIASPSRAQSLSAIRGLQVVDLTQPLRSNIPLFPGDPAFEIQPWASYDKDGYFINRISIGEHSGTHWGTPNTFIAGARSADRVAVEKLVVPAVVIDIRDKAKQNQDYRLSVQDIRQWERTNRRIAAGSVVILFTGWQDKWSDPIAFINKDANDVLHWPGFSADAVKFLVSQRQIVGLGTDTHGADAGNDQDYGASSAMYEADGMILECLGGLNQLPDQGATLIVGGLPIEGGSGSPARVFGLLPRRT